MLPLLINQIALKEDLLNKESWSSIGGYWMCVCVCFYIFVALMFKRVALGSFLSFFPPQGKQAKSYTYACLCDFTPISMHQPCQKMPNGSDLFLHGWQC